MKDLFFELDIQPQPTETTCGPTCLHGLFEYHNRDVPLNQLIEETPSLEEGGTLGVYLGLCALRHGLKSTIYTYNLKIFDPTWSSLSSEELKGKLVAQSLSKKSEKIRQSTLAYIEFLEEGGEIGFQELTPQFLWSTLNRHGPVICGLSATYLHQMPREFGPALDFDDINGDPQGHFVVLAGIDQKLSYVQVCDPMEHSPMIYQRYYKSDVFRFINSILLGVITYDANIIAIEK